MMQPELTDQQRQEQAAARARLEAEVERRRARGIESSSTLVFAKQSTPVEIRKPTGSLTKIVLDVLSGKQKLTEQEIADEEAYARRSRASTSDQERRDAERRMMEKRQKEWEQICPEEYRKQFKFSEVREGVDHSELKKILRWEYGPKGLYIFGTSGRSKTRAAYTRLARAFLKESLTVMAIGGVQFATEAAEAFRQTDITEKWVRKLAQVDILFLDDLGKRLTPTTIEALYAITERRTNQGKPIIATTNNRGSELREIAAAKGGVELVTTVETILRRFEDYTEIVKP